jgi:hypothetical protein
MKRNHRLAFNALKKIGAPVYERSDIENFQISAESNSDYIWADYYDGDYLDGYEFGVSPRIINTLAKYGLHAEWINPGELGVYD